VIRDNSRDPCLIIIIVITMSQESYALFCIGNPLLDIQVRNGEELLKKYNLNADDAILADEKHRPMLDFSFLQFLQFLDAHSSISSIKAMMRSSRNTRWSTSLVVQRRMLLEAQLYVSHSPFPIVVLLIAFFSPPVRAASKLRCLHRLRRRRRSRSTTQGGKQKGGSRRSVSRQEG
jgi:hypothetical protein